MRQKPSLPKIAKGTFGEVLALFEEHCEKRAALDEDNREHLADGTVSNYKFLIRWAHAVLGKYSATDPVNGIRPKVVLAALDLLMDKPGQRFNARAMLGALDTWAAPRELLPHSIVRGVTVVGSEGGHDPWSDAQVAHGEKHARADLSRVISLMAHLGQRGSDVVRMRLADIEENRDPITGHMVRGINVTTKKVGLRLWVPFTEEIDELVRVWRPEILAGGMQRRGLLVTKEFSETSEPYTRPQLSRHWNVQREGASELALLKEAGLVLHGLRGTCVVRYRKSGASPLEISSMIGMSFPMVERYCRFADRVDLSIAAVRRLTFGANRERKLFGDGPQTSQGIENVKK